MARTETKQFETVQILSLLTGVMLADDKGRGMQEMMAFVANDDWMNWWGIRTAVIFYKERTEELLLDQHPELAAFKQLPDGVDIDVWVASVIDTIGPSFSLTVELIEAQPVTR